MKFLFKTIAFVVLTGMLGSNLPSNWVELRLL